MGRLRRLRATISGSSAERGLDEEMRFHLEERANEYVRDGMTRQDARREADRRFGNVTLAREDARDVDSLCWLRDLVHDLGYALRMLRKHRGFAAMAILTLALGTGRTPPCSASSTR